MRTSPRRACSWVTPPRKSSKTPSVTWVAGRYVHSKFNIQQKTDNCIPGYRHGSMRRPLHQATMPIAKSVTSRCCSSSSYTATCRTTSPPTNAACISSDAPENHATASQEVFGHTARLARSVWTAHRSKHQSRRNPRQKRRLNRALLRNQSRTWAPACLERHR